MGGWLDALLPQAKDNGELGHPRRRGAITFNITQPTIIPFITQPTVYRVIVYALSCHGLASTTHFTELLTNQQFRLCHACDATHVNLRKTGYTMADVVKRQKNDVENHELTDFRHQSCNQLLVKYGWFQVRLSNTKVISWLFGRIVNTMPIVTVDRSMHYCPMPCGLGQ